MKINIKTGKTMEKEKNIFQMKKYNLKENIKMEKDEMEKDMIIMVF